MTPVLYPGDKIHIAIPGDFSSVTRGQRKRDDIVAAYKKLGITVFQVTETIHTQQVEIVSVIRVRSPRLRGPEKLKLVDDGGEGYHHQSVPPWMHAPDDLP